jgi:hypothetical protein
VILLPGRYAYVWGTQSWAAGKYRIRVDLGDGALHAEDVTMR